MTTRRVPERGSASVWVVVAGLLVLLAATVVAARTEAVLARHRAGVAADLAALAAAGQIGVRPTEELCSRAAKVAAADGGSVVSCTADLGPDGRSGTVLVTVAVNVSLPFVGRQQVRASARAARLPG
jgi:secretion/DNA translocation related TadE-like protein